MWIDNHNKSWTRTPLRTQAAQRLLVGGHWEISDNGKHKKGIEIREAGEIVQGQNTF